MHLQEDELQEFEKNDQQTRTTIDFLEHLSNCDFCLDQFLLEEENFCTSHTSPAYLKEQILHKAASPETQVVKSASDASRKMQLFYFSLRTAVGIIAALFLLFSIGQIHIPSVHFGVSSQTESAAEQYDTQTRNRLYDFYQGIGQNVSQGTHKINDYFHSFSNTIVNGGK